MNVKIAVVLLFAFVATSQAAYLITNSYSDNKCTNLIASFYTNLEGGCSEDEVAKRSVDQEINCNSDNVPGVHYNFDDSYCENGTIPSVPSTWQVIQLNSESTCNATAENSVTAFLAAPKDLSNSLIAIVTPQTMGLVAANVTMSCTSAGNLTASACFAIGEPATTVCVTFDLENNMCTLDSTASAYYGLQTTCAAAPVSPPVAAPVAEPISAPVKVPVKSPVMASSASIVYGSAALLAVIALL